jgi:hypothetical protein
MLTNLIEPSTYFRHQALQPPTDNMAPRSDDQGLNYLQIEQVDTHDADLVESEKIAESDAKLIKKADSFSTEEVIEVDSAGCIDFYFLAFLCSGSERMCAHCNEPITYNQAYVLKGDEYMHSGCNEAQKTVEVVKTRKSLVMTELAEAEQAKAELRKQAEDQVEQDKMAEIQRLAEEAAIKAEEEKKVLEAKKKGFFKKMISGRKRKSTKVAL